MKNRMLAVTVAAVIGASFVGTATAATMTDDNVTQLLKAGFGPDVVIAKIKASQTAFDVSDTKLIELKGAGVPDAVIAAMISAGTDADAASIDSPDPSVNHKPGLYVLDVWDSPSRMIVIDSQTSKAVKSTNGFGAFMLGPAISPMHAQAMFDGSSAKIKVSSNSPTFYFYFNKNASSSDISSGDSIINSPSDFSLVKFGVKDDYRRLTVGKFGGILGGNRRGISQKDSINFTAHQVSNYVYAVTTDKPLPAGEYAFVVEKGEGHALKAYSFTVTSGSPRS